MWTIAHYQPVALFSLKTASATSSGGKTLLCPTPFSIKMALLDAAIRVRGVHWAKQFWQQCRDLHIQLQLPTQIVVVNTFTKIVRPKKNGPSDDNGVGLVTPFGSTIAYREYVQYGGSFTLALQSPQEEALSEDVSTLLPQLNYLGKRGGFIQFRGSNNSSDQSLSETFTEITTNQTTFAFQGTMQILDDCDQSLTFEQVDIYSGKRITLGKERILRHIILPYRLTRSSRGFSLYEHIM